VRSRIFEAFYIVARVSLDIRKPTQIREEIPPAV